MTGGGGKEIKKGGEGREEQERKGGEGEEERKKRITILNAEQYVNTLYCQHRNENDGPTEQSLIAWVNMGKDLVVASFINLTSQSSETWS